MDEMVLKAQRWVNATYRSVAGYIECPEDGSTGWRTMYALTRALQSELGIASLSDAFGPTTMARLEAYGPVGAASKPNIIKIAQSAFFCKGYSAGDIDGTWGNRLVGTSTDFAVFTMMSDVGLSDSRDGTLKPKAFKSLLTMDAYRLLSGGSTEVRAIQQWLNANYWNKSFGAVVPCDGHYSRDVQQSLMKAIQFACGVTEAQVNGNFGPGTQQGLRNNPQQQGNSGLFVRLLSAACVFNGEVILNGTSTRTIFKESFDQALGTYLAAFQRFSLLPETGKADYATWCQLLVSSGDPDRPAGACDTRFTITQAMATSLASNGYKVVGRYLANDPGGWDKNIKAGELNGIFTGGMRVFPIFQLNARRLIDFTYEAGLAHGAQAHECMVHYSFNPSAVVYFAVDYDATNDEISSNIVPYFRGIQAALLNKGRRYRAGVYGSRNVCSRVSKETLVVSSFVSGMSWGFSGNLGFPLPANWAFNQIKEFSYTGGGGTIDLDRNVHRASVDPGIGRDGIGGTTPSTSTAILAFVDQVQALAVRYGGADPNVRVLEYLRSPTYTKTYQGWDILLGLWDQAWLDYANSHFGNRGDSQLKFSDPSYGETVNLDHLAATAAGVLIKGVGTGSAVTRGDFAGWGGDLTTFYADWRNNTQSFASGGAFAADRLAVRGKVSSWSFGDMIEDVDGSLVGAAMRSGATFASALRSHLTGTGHTTRFRRFYATRFGSSVTTARSAATKMLTDASTDSTLHVLRDALIVQSSSPLVVLPKDLAAAQRDQFVSGFADRLVQLAAIG